MSEFKMTKDLEAQLLTSMIGMLKTIIVAAVNGLPETDEGVETLGKLMDIMGLTKAEKLARSSRKKKDATS